LMHACATHDLVGTLEILTKAEDACGLLSTMFEETLPSDLWLQPGQVVRSTELFSWGVGHNFQLGYAKDKQTYPKRLAFSSSIFDS